MAAKLEADDLFVRTIETEPNPEHSSSDDDDSELEFEGNSASGFFESERPAGWDLGSAQAAAEKKRPYQTSVQAKIAASLANVKKPNSGKPDASSAEPENDSDADGDDGDEEENKSDASESDSPVEPDEEEEDEVDEPKPKPGKKRQRKEARNATSFEDLNLSRALLKAVSKLDWNTPTPVQARAIPCILAGRDVCGSAVTGSGKTGAFVLPILERLIKAGVDNSTRVVILLPTRELAAQCHAVIVALAKYTNIRAALTVGGLSNTAQETALRTRPHILVATPGRLIDHIRNAPGFALDEIEILVMDEADRLLDMGFKDEVEEIVGYTPQGRQTLLFSATMNSGVGELAKLSLQRPAKLAVDAMFDVAATLTQEFVKLKALQENNKDAVLLALAHRTFKKRVIVFFRQKVTCHRFCILLGLARLRVGELHGNLTQAQRLAALDDFRRADVDFLLCTDLAARGLDIAGVDAVINYDMPHDVREYVHRVGRTARAGKNGRCCSLVCSDKTDERKVLNAVAKKARDRLVARTVPPAVVMKWRNWIDSMQPNLKKVLREERAEMMMRKAEMELTKAENLMKHEAEIFARPKRTWFQSNKEKDDVKEDTRLKKGLGPSANKIKEQERKQAAVKDKKRQLDKDDEDNEYAKQKVNARRAKRKKSRKK